MLQVSVSFSVLLFSLGLDQAYIREYHDSKNTPHLLKNTLWPGLILLTLTVGMSLFRPEKISSLIFGVDSIQLGLLGIVCILFSFLSQFLSLILRMEEKGLVFSLSQVLPKFLFISLIFIFVYLDTGYTTLQLVTAHTLSIVFVFIIISLNTKKEWMSSVCQNFNFAEVIKMLKYSIPLIFGGLAFWGLTAVDKIFLRTFSGYEDLGMYSVAVNFAAVGTIFQGIFTTIWVPTVYRWVSLGENLDKVHVVRRYVLFVVVLLFCLSGIFSWAIDYVLPEAYSSIKYILVACLGYPLFYTLSETTVIGIGITKKTVYSLASSCIALICNVIGNYILVPSYGATGAAISTCVSFWLFFICRTEFSNLAWKKIPRFKLYTFTTISVLLSIMMALFRETGGGIMVTLWIFLLFCILFVEKSIVFDFFRRLSWRI